MAAFIAAAAVVVVTLGVLALAHAVEETGALPVGQPAPGWPGRVRVRHLWVGLAAVAALFVAAVSPGLLGALSALVALVLFARAWAYEFRFLMALRDDDFPGRYDKPIWAALLVAAAPVGLWLFRAHRLAHWPEPAGGKDPAGAALGPDVI